MKSLVDLFRFVKKHSPDSLYYLGKSLKSSPRTKLLFEILKRNDSISETEACLHVYGTRDVDKRFRETKARLRARLLDCVVLVTDERSNPSQIERVFSHCNKAWVVVRTLLVRGVQDLAIELAEHSLRKTLKYEMTSLSILFCRQLLIHSAIVHNRGKRYQKLKSRLHQLERIRTAEIEAELAMTQLFSMNVNTQGHIGEKQLSDFKEILRNLLHKHSDISSRHYLRMFVPFHMAILELSGDINQSLKIGFGALEIFNNKPYETILSKIGIELRMLAGFIKLKRYGEANVKAAFYLSFFRRGTSTWNTIAIYYFILCTHSEQYIKALDILLKAVDPRHFNTLYPNRKQFWHVYEAYIHFLIRRGKISQADLRGKTLKNFRLYKFLNNVPIYEKDKRGINISILIIHMLFLIDQRKFSKVHDRVDALNQYCYRYLRRDDTFRSNCFIKMLIQVAKADFNRIRTERYAQPYHKKLLSMPLAESRQGIEMEVMPYEHLWEMVLEMLD